MSTVTVTLKKQPELYFEADLITPDQFAGKSAEEIGAVEISEGKIKYPLSTVATIGGAPGVTAAETMIVLNGDWSRVKRIGQQMTAGEIVINSNTDMYTGGWMKGGKITVNGDVDSFTGIAMAGGELMVNGKAENHVGCAYRGDWRGMTGGVLRVTGSAGNDIGTFMRGGTIIIEGDVFIHVLTHGEGGTIIIKGNVEGRVGGQAVKGAVYVFGTIKYMMPGYKYVDNVEAEIDGEKAVFAHYIGDLGERHPTSKNQIVFANLYLKK
ncbi:MAG: formylmethanofuran dehydrogenase subunit C [Methanocalculaceae archaeon]|jgi:formylmethanofuran dehydrogenase subunit C|nr:formylmethanofuran dehydrogenase subunit C [Methanocalculaceae archaeon]